MRHLCVLPVLCAALLCLLPGTSGARYWHWAEFTAPRHEGSYLHVIRTDRVLTPCLPFARPLAGGPVRALFIIPKAGVQTRDVVELWQRLDLEFEAVTINGGDDFCDDFPLTTAVRGESTPEKALELSEKLNQTYDVIVLANCLFDVLPAESQAKILRAVRNGTGLLGVFEVTKPREVRFFQPLDPPVTGREILRGIPLAGLPYFEIDEGYTRDQAADDVVTAARFGQGRIVWLNYGKAAHIINSWYAGDCLGRPALPTSEGYDAALSLAARALLWAARREPAAQVVMDLHDGAPIAQANWPEAFPVRIRARGEGPPQEYAVEAHLVRAASEYAATATAKTRAAAVCEVSFPVPPRGPAFLWVIARDAEGAVVDWHATTVEVTAPRELTLTAESAVLAPGDPAQLTVSVQGAVPPGAALGVELIDSYDRVAWQDEQPAAAEVVLTMPTSGVCGRYARARVRLVADGTVLNTASAEFFLRRELGHAFPHLLWGYAGKGRCDWQARGYVNDLIGQHLREAGFNVGMIFPPGRPEYAEWAAQALSRTDAHWMFYCSHVTDDRLRSYFDPAVRQQDDENLEDLARRLRPYGTWVYSLGDENDYSVHEDLRPLEFEAYRAHLRREYGDDIARLNAAWGTQYVSFDGVEVRPVGTDSLAPRYDLICFWERAYAEAHHRKRSALRRGDPEALVGAEGSFSGDLEYTVSAQDWWAPYEDRMVNAMLRFWMPPDSLRGNWWGSYSMHRYGPRTLWGQLATGSVNSSLFFIAALASEGMLAPDGGLAEFFEAWEPELREICERAGPLLRAAEPLDDGVGIFWSRRSEIANELDPRFGNAHLTQLELLTLCDRLGVNARFVTERQLVAGLVAPADIPFLILPLAKAVSDELAPALEAYVRGGGVLVADVAPDLRDSHCAEVAPGRLLRIFGVTAEGPPTVVKAPVSFGAVSVAGAALSLATGECSLDGSLRPQQARPLATAGETPILFAHELGRGTALLLNFDLYNALLQARAEQPRTTPAGDFLVALLALADLEPEFPPLPGLPWDTVRRFRHADATIVGLDQGMADDAGPTVFPVGAERRAHLLWEGVAEDAVGRLPLPADRPDSLLFAVLPTVQRELRLTGPARCRAGDRPTYNLALLVGGRPLAQSLVRVDVLDAQGSPLPAFRQFLLSGNGVSYTWPVAYNQPVGTYTVHATELVSGTAGHCSVTVGE